jgi:hypothetical protein
MAVKQVDSQSGETAGLAATSRILRRSRQPDPVEPEESEIVLASNQAMAKQATLKSRSAAEVSRKQPAVSIVIPAYNEEHGIDPVLARLGTIMTASEVNYEIIVVDDGSQDNTAATALPRGNSAATRVQPRLWGSLEDRYTPRAAQLDMHY